MFIGAGERIREFVEDSFELAPRILRAAGMKGEKALGELEKIPVCDLRLLPPGVASVQIDGTEHLPGVEVVHEGAGSVVDGFSRNGTVIGIHHPVNESDQHPLGDQLGLPGGGQTKEGKCGNFLCGSLGVVAGDHVIGQGSKGVKVSPRVVILESAHPDVTAGHPGEDCAGQRALADDLFPGGDHSKGPGSWNPERGHRFAHHVFPDGGTKGGTAVSPAGEDGRTRSLQLDVVASSVRSHNLAEKDCPAVPELGNPPAELVAGVGECNGFGPLRESVACKNVGREVPGGDSNFLSQGMIEAKEGWGGHRGGVDPGVEVPGEASVAVVECGGHYGSSHHRAGGCTPLFWLLPGEAGISSRFSVGKCIGMFCAAPFSFRGWVDPRARAAMVKAMLIEGKAAIVTGASRGVGAATALSLARQGCSVLINYAQSSEAAAAVCKQIEGCGGQATLFQGDVSDDAVCRGMVEAAVEEFGRLDILINNAGTTEFIPADDFEAVNDEVWSRLMDVNVKAAFQCVRAARPHLEAAGSAEILSVASVAAFTGRGSCIPYCASKGALVTMTKSLARVLGPKGVRVNAVAPGFIKGDWLRRGVGENYDSFVAEKEAEAPLQTSCTPEDVADVILGLITGSDLVTGESLTVDAGHTLGGGW